MTRVRRVLLFMPGDSLPKIQKGITLGVDSIVMDLEDGVAFNRKTEARQTVLQALTTLDFGRSERLVRLNAAGSGSEAEDLATTIAGRPDGYVLPKVESAEVVRRISREIAAAEEAHGWPRGSIGLLALIETARGVLNLAEIAGADTRLQALLFGAEDLAGSLGATRTQDGWEVFHARSAVVIAAAAYGLQAIDTPHVALTDLDGLVRECRRAAEMGYVGKLAIHPRQVDPICAAFTPSQEAVEQALRLLQAHESQQEGGSGVFALESKMVDMPMVRAAQQVLAKARAAGMIS